MTRPHGDVVAPLPEGWEVASTDVGHTAYGPGGGYADVVESGHGRAGAYLSVQRREHWLPVLCSTAIRVMHDRGDLEDYYRRRKAWEASQSALILPERIEAKCPNCGGPVCWSMNDTRPGTVTTAECRDVRRRGDRRARPGDVGDCTWTGKIRRIEGGMEIAEDDAPIGNHADVGEPEVFDGW